MENSHPPWISFRGAGRSRARAPPSACQTIFASTCSASSARSSGLQSGPAGEPRQGAARRAPSMVSRMSTGEVSQIPSAPRRSRRGLLQRVLPSRDGASDHASHETLVNARSARESFTPMGSNLPGYDNYFCRDCLHIVHVRKGSPGFRACPTPGCTRPTGFGVYATMPRPREPRQAKVRAVSWSRA